jgi:hypothetical protein
VPTVARGRFLETEDCEEIDGLACSPGASRPAGDLGHQGLAQGPVEFHRSDLHGRKGQGPDSSNFAACHCFAFLPETHGEEQNRLLDRAAAMGIPDGESMGFFNRWGALELP